MRAVMPVFLVILVMPFFYDRSDVSVFRVIQSNDARIFSESSDAMKAVMVSSVMRLRVFSDSSDASVFSETSDVDVSVFSKGSNDSVFSESGDMSV